MNIASVRSPSCDTRSPTPHSRTILGAPNQRRSHARIHALPSPCYCRRDNMICALNNHSIHGSKMHKQFRAFEKCKPALVDQFKMEPVPLIPKTERATSLEAARSNPHRETHRNPVRETLLVQIVDSYVRPFHRLRQNLKCGFHRAQVRTNRRVRCYPSTQRTQKGQHYLTHECIHVKPPQRFSPFR